MTVRSANLALRFLLELCGLAAVGYWGARTGHGLLSSVALAVGAPLLFAFIWGMFIAPRALVQTSTLVRFVLGLVVLLVAAAALAVAGLPILALVFAVIVVGNAALMYVWNQ